jgi:large subunit ribosomal protein L2
MPIKKYKPNTPGLRTKSTIINSDLSKNKPFKELTRSLKKSTGRNNSGSITVRHHGGGVKRKYRIIDFKRDFNCSGVVQTIEYDPYRSSFVSLVKLTNGKRVYILSPKGIKVGDKIESGQNADIALGSSLKLKDLPVGSQIHNIELTPGRGAQLVRTAGSFAVLMAKSNKYASVRLPSGEIRLVFIECSAVYGRLSNEEHSNTCHGKAGISRKLNRRPTVRGSVMNAADHKHGGGEGRAPIGLSGPYTAYGKKANTKTRSLRKSNKYIVRGRKR